VQKQWKEVDKIIYLLICYLLELLLALLVVGVAVVEAVIHSQGIAQKLLTETAKQQSDQ
jgi:hypothetical protein